MDMKTLTRGILQHAIPEEILDAEVTKESVKRLRELLPDIAQHTIKPMTKQELSEYGVCVYSTVDELKDNLLVSLVLFGTHLSEVQTEEKLRLEKFLLGLRRYYSEPIQRRIIGDMPIQLDTFFVYEGKQKKEHYWFTTEQLRKNHSLKEGPHILTDTKELLLQDLERIYSHGMDTPAVCESYETNRVYAYVCREYMDLYAVEEGYYTVDDTQTPYVAGKHYVYLTTKDYQHLFEEGDTYQDCLDKYIYRAVIWDLQAVESLLRLQHIEPNDPLTKKMCIIDVTQAVCVPPITIREYIDGMFDVINGTFGPTIF